jgi:hypothetical protein
MRSRTALLPALPSILPIRPGLERLPPSTTCGCINFSRNSRIYQIEGVRWSCQMANFGIPYEAPQAVVEAAREMVAELRAARRWFLGRWS